MTVQVLASVMHVPAGGAGAVARKMNLKSSAVVVNQCDRLDYEETQVCGEKIQLFSFPDRGVGRSRNEAILRAEGDICLFSDADIVYESDYPEKIRKEFHGNPKADMILFQIEVEEARKTYEITARRRVRWYNCGRYGAVSFAVRRESLLACGVTFSLLFGGGARYSNGEDSLFLQDFLKKGRRIYTAPVTIGREEPGESSWFEGCHRKFFVDRGVLYRFLYGKLAAAMALRFLLAHRGKLCREVGIAQAFAWMREGWSS
jgi:glycosyltransferase involved in cell wall biosynthesis